MTLPEIKTAAEEAGLLCEASEGSKHVTFIYRGDDIVATLRHGCTVFRDNLEVLDASKFPAIMKVLGE